MYGTDDLGAYFSVGPVNMSIATALPVTPQVKNTAECFLVDVDEWMLVEGAFVAAGGEDHIVIGNFESPADTDVVEVAPSGFRRAYYYVDDVNVERVLNEVAFVSPRTSRRRPEAPLQWTSSVGSRGGQTLRSGGIAHWDAARRHDQRRQDPGSIWTPYTLIPIQFNNTPLFTNTIGVLDSDGHGRASIQLPPLGPAFAGITFYHAFVVFTQAGILSGASNAVSFTLGVRGTTRASGTNGSPVDSWRRPMCHRATRAISSPIESLAMSEAAGSDAESRSESAEPRRSASRGALSRAARDRPNALCGASAVATRCRPRPSSTRPFCAFATSVRSGRGTSTSSRSLPARCGASWPITPARRAPTSGAADGRAFRSTAS